MVSTMDTGVQWNRHLRSGSPGGNITPATTASYRHLSKQRKNKVEILWDRRARRFRRRSAIRELNRLVCRFAKSSKLAA